MNTLVEQCCRVVADALTNGSVPANFPAAVPEPELLLRIYHIYQARTAVSPADHGSLLRHLLALQAFAEEWQLPQLRLRLPQPASPRALTQLALPAARLRHLELQAATWLPDLTWLPAVAAAAAAAGGATAGGTTGAAAGGAARAQTAAAGREQGAGGSDGGGAGGGAGLTCLALRGCTGLRGGRLAGLAAVAATLRVLDLSGCEALDDGAAAVLASLTALQALNLSHTAVGDPTLEALTYGARLHGWARQAGVAPPEAAAWPELRIHRWHLAATRVTAAGLAHLGALPLLTFLDVRGTGVARACLRPLERRFSLTLVQGAVLAASLALAAAAVNRPDALACACDPAEVAALGPVAPAAAAARARRRAAAVQRLRDARAREESEAAVEAGGGVKRRRRGDGEAEGQRDDGAWAAAAAVPFGHATLAPRAPQLPAADGRGGGGGGGDGGGDWYVQWATSGIEAMVATAEALLRWEAFQEAQSAPRAAPQAVQPWAGRAQAQAGQAAPPRAECAGAGPWQLAPAGPPWGEPG